MLKVAIVGVGFMGWIHYLAYKKGKGMKLAAISARDPKKLAGDWRGIKGNFGPPGEQVDLKGIKAYADYNELLKDPTIDVVDICLPPHLHLKATLAALNAGKHVFVEKPMALTASDCDKMVAAAAKAGKQVAVGHVLPFFPEYTAARKIIASGKYGKPIGGFFKRVISDPLWIPDFYDPKTIGGPLVDLHVHDAHFIRLVFGMPTAVTSQGRTRDDVVEYCTTQFRFADPRLAVSAASGVINQQGRPFTHAFEIHLEKATLFFEFAALADGNNITTPFTILDHKGQVERPTLGSGDNIDCFAAEIKEVAKSIAAGKPSDVLSGELARDAIVLCAKQTESVRKGKPVSV